MRRTPGGAAAAAAALHRRRRCRPAGLRAPRGGGRPSAALQPSRACTHLAVGETVLLLHPPLPLVGVSIVIWRERQLQPPLPLVGVSIVMWRERHQNDSLADGECLDPPFGLSLGGWNACRNFKTFDGTPCFSPTLKRIQAALPRPTAVLTPWRVIRARRWPRCFMDPATASPDGLDSDRGWAEPQPQQSSHRQHAAARTTAPPPFVEHSLPFVTHPLPFVGHSLQGAVSPRGQRSRG